MRPLALSRAAGVIAREVLARPREVLEAVTSHANVMLHTTALRHRRHPLVRAALRQWWAWALRTVQQDASGGGATILQSDDQSENGNGGGRNGGERSCESENGEKTGAPNGRGHGSHFKQKNTQFVST